MEMSNKRGAFSISRVWLLPLAGWFWFQTVCGSGSTSESESEIESGSKTAPLRSAQLWKVGGGWLGGWVAWGWRNLRPTNAPCDPLGHTATPLSSRGPPQPPPPTAFVAHKCCVYRFSFFPCCVVYLHSNFLPRFLCKSHRNKSQTLPIGRWTFTHIHVTNVVICALW